MSLHFNLIREQRLCWCFLLLCDRDGSIEGSIVYELAYHLLIITGVNVWGTQNSRWWNTHNGNHSMKMMTEIILPLRAQVQTSSIISYNDILSKQTNLQYATWEPVCWCPSCSMYCTEHRARWDVTEVSGTDNEADTIIYLVHISLIPSFHLLSSFDPFTLFRSV